jgi:Ni/Fe-hydrogenase 1 B-type cytochrome subunit
MAQSTLKAYPVWDGGVRLFHWINVLAILGLLAVGLMLMFSKDFGVTDDGKILLKAVHIWIGYVFVINLLARFVWAFLGNRFARWKAFLPFGKLYKAQFQDYIQGRKIGKDVHFLGHNPLGRWSILLMFLLMIGQGITGLMLASTDLYMAPFGSQMKAWVAEDEAAIAIVQPYEKQGVDPIAYQEMRDFRKPFRTLHTYFFYLLMLSIVIHIAAVIIEEKRRRNGLTSAMITGEKVFKEKPFDVD